MNKILFLHGFYASGQCEPAVALSEALEGRAEVLTPDSPLYPKDAIEFIRELIDREKPDLLVGNSFIRRYMAIGSIGCIRRRCSSRTSPVTAGRMQDSRKLTNVIINLKSNSQRDIRGAGWRGSLCKVTERKPGTG